MLRQCHSYPLGSTGPGIKCGQSKRQKFKTNLYVPEIMGGAPPWIRAWSLPVPPFYAYGNTVKATIYKKQQYYIKS